jgi:hypothetical protein
VVWLAFVIASGLAFGLGISDLGVSYLIPAATTIVAAVAASLARIVFSPTGASADPGSPQRPIRASTADLYYRWVVEVVGAAVTAAALFFLATLAFHVSIVNSFNYPGLVVFGVVAGLCGSQFALSLSITAASLGRSTPFSEITTMLKDQLTNLEPALLSGLEPVLRNAIVGPATPDYRGWLRTEFFHPLLPGEPSQPEDTPRSADLRVWFDSIDPGANVRAHPVRIYPSGAPQSPDSGDSKTADAVPTSFTAELLLHLRDSVGSPLSKSMDVPVRGQSKEVTFSLPARSTGDNQILLEVRVGGRIVNIIEVQA